MFEGRASETDCVLGSGAVALVVVVFVAAPEGEEKNAFPPAASSYCGDVVFVLPVGLTKAVLGEGCVSSRER